MIATAWIARPAGATGYAPATAGTDGRADGRPAPRRLRVAGLLVKQDRTYTGLVGHDGEPVVNVVRVDAAGVTRRRRLVHYVCHAERFGWGHDGEAAADLAVAILADASGDWGLALVLGWRFMREHIAKLPRRGEWQLSGTIVADWLRAHVDADARAEARRRRRFGREAAGIREVRR